jgi:hypothetical protein
MLGAFLTIATAGLLVTQPGACIAIASMYALGSMVEKKGGKK